MTVRRFTGSPGVRIDGVNVYGCPGVKPSCNHNLWTLDNAAHVVLPGCGHRCQAKKIKVTLTDARVDFDLDLNFLAQLLNPICQIPLSHSKERETE